MEARYDSALFAPVGDPGLLEGLVMLTLDELGIDREGLSMFRRTFEHHRDELLQARETADAERLDRLVKKALKYVPKYAHLKTLESDLDLNPDVLAAYERERGELLRDASGPAH